MRRKELEFRTKICEHTGEIVHYYEMRSLAGWEAWIKGMGKNNNYSIHDPVGNYMATLFADGMLRFKQLYDDEYFGKNLKCAMRYVYLRTQKPIDERKEKNTRLQEIQNL